MAGGIVYGLSERSILMNEKFQECFGLFLFKFGETIHLDSTIMNFMVKGQLYVTIQKLFCQ